MLRRPGDPDGRGGILPLRGLHGDLPHGGSVLQQVDPGPAVPGTEGEAAVSNEELKTLEQLHEQKRYVDRDKCALEAKLNAWRREAAITGKQVPPEEFAETE